MNHIEYRLFFDGKQANQKQLGKVTAVEVAQEIHMAWEAKLNVPICADPNGRWNPEKDFFATSFKRVRIEVKIGKSDWVALIDGPIIGYDTNMSGDPGKSSVIMVIQDDTVYLNRTDEINKFKGKTPKEIVETLFQKHAPTVKNINVDNPASDSKALQDEKFQKGKAMPFLIDMAKHYQRFVYVMPGKTVGESEGYFKEAPTEVTDLKCLPLVVLGPKRNVKEFNVREDAAAPAAVKAGTIKLGDKSTVTTSVRLKELPNTGEPDVKSLLPTANQFVPHSTVYFEETDQAAKGVAENQSYTYTAEGALLGCSYAGVLRPYQLVTVRAGDLNVSGEYLIQAVTHVLNRFTYAQTFKLQRKPITPESAGAEPGGIFP